MMQYVYKYDEKTKEYLGKAEAMLDPLESQLQQKEIYLLPADATFLAPKLQEGCVSVFNRNPSFLVVWSALLHFLCLFSLHHFWWFATTTSVLKPIN